MKFKVSQEKKHFTRKNFYASSENYASKLAINLLRQMICSFKIFPKAVVVHLVNEAHFIYYTEL